MAAGTTALVVSPSHAEGNRFTAEIRHALKSYGVIDGERADRACAGRPQPHRKPNAAMRSIASLVTCWYFTWR
ncbi:MAG TPA: hypothetical protein VGX76_13285, partial [Pirellulales bacterium]|nr:hypothetical protein [Pirellulales bacterium]